MNDIELITVLRESVADVHSATPVAQIISRGRVMRARRRAPAVAGAAAMAAGTALAVTTLVGSGHPGGHPASARLAAWTVAKQANGEIDVTINQLQNPADLQSMLRADGLPVNVTFSGHSPSASCQPYPASQDVLSAVVHFNTIGNSVALVINPSALPGGTGVVMFDQPEGGVPVHTLPWPRGASVPRGIVEDEGIADFNISAGHLREVLALQVGLVSASQPCTG